MNNYLKVAVLQLECFSFENRDNCRKHIFEMISRALIQKPDIILLPECSYPSYYLNYWNTDVETEIESIISELAHIAKENSIYIACGLPEVVDKREGTGSKEVFYNSIYVLDSTGNIACIGRKRFLWHFDSMWFSPGDISAAFDTKWGKIGLMICADGRMPEIVQSLKLQGCKLILNSTNWVCNGRHKETLSNPQSDYLMSVRARESGAWIAAANKVGIEEDFIVYCGNSMVVDPNGNVIKKADSCSPNIMICNIPLDSTSGEILCHEDIFSDNCLNNQFEIIDITQNTEKKEFDDYIYIAVSQIGINKNECKAEDIINKINFSRTKADVVKADMLILTVDLKNVEVLKDLLSYKEFCMKILNNLLPSKCDVLIHFNFKNVVYFDFYIKEDSCNNIIELSGPTVLKADDLMIGVVNRESLLTCDLTRSMMIAGSQVVIWMCDNCDKDYANFSRARAMENRIYTVCMNGVIQQDSNYAYNSIICDPDGRIIAETFDNTEQMICTYLDIKLTERKSVAPGTDVLKTSFDFRQI